eukprot:scaffold220416_cov51-Prasinocladus_malaysianus.AAC.1
MAEWKDGAVPTEAAFRVGGRAVLRLLHMLTQAPDVARVIADEVEVFPPLLWACLTRCTENNARLSQVRGCS